MAVDMFSSIHSSEKREEILEQAAKGQLKVIVATTAFSMV